MKLATDLVNAVLIKDGVVPVSITEMPVQSLVNPLTQVHLSLYLKTTHLSRFVPDYVETLKDCPVSYDIGLELQQCISSAELLCEDMESLEFISVCIELYKCNSKQLRFEESKRVKYGNEMLEVTLKAIALCSMDRYLKSFTSLRTEAAASGFIKCVKSYISTGWRHGYIVCHYYRNGQSLGKSLPLFISETSEYSIQKRVNRLISSTISGRNKDLGLSDF